MYLYPELQWAPYSMQTGPQMYQEYDWETIMGTVDWYGISSKYILVCSAQEEITGHFFPDSRFSRLSAVIDKQREGLSLKVKSYGIGEGG